MLLQHRDLRKWRAFLKRSAGGPGCQVLEYLVGKLGEDLPPLMARRWMIGMGVGVIVVMWIS